jgi:succinoglycan biosynthesis protein ExoM
MKIDICICTFRRASLSETLSSVANQDLPDHVDISVIVADNDEQDVRKQSILDEGAALGLNLTYVFAPKFNISVARNACLNAATGDCIAFIDDDEIARPDWLARLLARASETGAAVVFGPAKAVYPTSAPSWMMENDFHSNIPASNRNGVVETGFSGNVLLDRSNLILRELRFDEAFGRTGGEDVDFFFRAHRAGIKLDVSVDAWVDEAVPDTRLSLNWLIKRMHSFGVIYGHCALSSGARSWTPILAKSLATTTYCLLRGLLAVLSKKKMSFWMLRGVFHFGVLHGCFSKPTRLAYGKKQT